MSTALSTTASKAPQAGVDLLRIVRINEEIKLVVGVAFKINIMALNAIFLPNAPVRQRGALGCSPTSCACFHKTCVTAWGR